MLIGGREKRHRRIRIRHRVVKKSIDGSCKAPKMRFKDSEKLKGKYKKAPRLRSAEYKNYQQKFSGEAAFLFGSLRLSDEIRGGKRIERKAVSSDQEMETEDTHLETGSAAGRMQPTTLGSHMDLSAGRCPDLQLPENVLKHN